MKYLALLLFALGFGASAQKISYGFSQPFNIVEKYIPPAFCRLPNNGFAHLYYLRGKYMTLQVFDENAKTMRKQENLKLPENIGKFESEGFYSIKDNFYWFYSFRDKKSNTERLSGLVFDKTSLRFKDKEITLLETGKLESSDKYKFYCSADSSRLLIVYTKTKQNNNKQSKTTIGFHVLDDKLDKVYAVEIEMPYPASEMKNLDYDIDSKGNIYLFTQILIPNPVRVDEDEEEQPEKKYRYVLMRLKQSSNTFETVNIGISDKYITTFSMKEDWDHYMSITGYYANDKNKIVNGVFLVRFTDENFTSQTSQATHLTFTSEMLMPRETEDGETRLTKKNDNIGITNLNLRKVLFNDDGTMLLIGEQEYVTTSVQVGGTFDGTINYIYHYDNIIVIKMNKDGKLVWCRNIPKSQTGQVLKTSFYYHRHKGMDYFFHLDSNETTDLNAANESAPYGPNINGEVLSCVRIDLTGKMNKHQVLNCFKEGIDIYPTRFESINGRVIVGKINSARKESQILTLEIN